MSRLRIFPDADGSHALAEHHDGDAIATALAEVGIHFERWPTHDDVCAGATQDTVLQRYAEEVRRIMEDGGYQSCDVVSMTPENPSAGEARGKFLAEHTHEEDEVRFFVDGAGLFTLHLGAQVYEVLCERGDFLRVPANTKHWFDMGPTPHFLAIRIFSNPDGWAANFTGSPIAERFPRFEPSPCV
ncbi:MAG: cupin domain-containing protein [Proteobacteria bacterium]|jgi:1,2-dihydroxy-3-keto-5-methylthiopentene dioxygenase|nr:cupin domain-containing protein [Pseudomonadota bacterium]